MNLEELEVYNHKISIALRFMDLDPMQHVNNARYFNFLEEARIAYWKDVFHQKIDSAVFHAVVARVEIDYKAAIYYGEEIEVYSRVSRIGNKSLSFDCTIVAIKNDERKISAHSIATIVKLSPKNHKPARIEEKIKDAIRKFETLSN